MAKKGIGTKVRHVKSKDDLKCETFIGSLPFKVEIKSIYFVEGKHIFSFALDETDPATANFVSIDLDKAGL